MADITVQEIKEAQELLQDEYNYSESTVCGWTMGEKKIAISRAISALNALIPRLLTLEELHHIAKSQPRKPIFVEEHSQFHENHYTSARMLSTFIPNGQGSAVYNTDKEVDWGWRAWTFEPSGEQMANTPWGA